VFIGLKFVIGGGGGKSSTSTNQIIKQKIIITRGSSNMESALCARFQVGINTTFFLNNVVQWNLLFSFSCGVKNILYCKFMHPKDMEFEICATRKIEDW
jgi:hypothetical protein